MHAGARDHHRVLTPVTFATQLLWFDFFAVAVFAATGALAAAERRLDILGFVLFATITGVGGGTLRDLLLQGSPVFWISRPGYLWVCTSAAVLVWYLSSRLRPRLRALLWADAAGLALFSVLGTEKALAAGAPATVAVVLGVMSATFGSLLRDTLLQRQPVLLEAEIYVTAAFAGAASYALLTRLSIAPPGANLALSLGVGFGLRGAALCFGLRLPSYRG